MQPRPRDEKLVVDPRPGNNKKISIPKPNPKATKGPVVKPQPIKPPARAIKAPVKPMPIKTAPNKQNPIKVQPISPDDKIYRTMPITEKDLGTIKKMYGIK